MDDKKIEQGVTLILEGIGEDIHREGLLDTPGRISAMCHEIFAGLEQKADEHLCRTFQAEDTGMVLEKDITFYSVCEHHLLPFYGKAHIAYIPDGKVVGLSKLARTVEVYARRPQIQEQLTAQIADAVMIEAEHMCMTMRGVKKPGTQTVTYAARGEMEEPKNQQMFFSLMERSR